MWRVRRSMAKESGAGPIFYEKGGTILDAWQEKAEA
jgi:hypothetical protein